jgi:hypothetical protein
MVAGESFLFESWSRYISISNDFVIREQQHTVNGYKRPVLDGAQVLRLRSSNQDKTRLVGQTKCIEPTLLINHKQ